jgi:hypothetical protein
MLHVLVCREPPGISASLLNHRVKRKPSDQLLRCAVVGLVVEKPLRFVLCCAHPDLFDLAGSAWR